MFKEMGQMANLLRALPKLREEMDRMQERLGQITAEADAGGGMVKVKVNGRLQVLSCALSEEAMKSGDREMLEDLIVAATNQALSKVREQGAGEAGKLASNLGLPAGLNLPGLT